jgi:hypothetical protein
MPTNQAPAMRSALDRIEAALNDAADTADLQRVRAVLSRPTEISVADQTFLLVLIEAIEQQVAGMRTLRAGLVAAAVQMDDLPERPRPPEGTSRERPRGRRSGQE